MCSATLVSGQNQQWSSHWLYAVLWWSCSSPLNYATLSNLCWRRFFWNKGSLFWLGLTIFWSHSAILRWCTSSRCGLKRWLWQMQRLPVGDYIGNPNSDSDWIRRMFKQAYTFCRIVYRCRLVLYLQGESWTSEHKWALIFKSPFIDGWCTKRENIKWSTSSLASFHLLQRHCWFSLRKTLLQFNSGLVS